MLTSTQLIGFADTGIRPSADIITNHTSSTSASGTAAASTETGGAEAWRAFDGLTTSADHWGATTTSGWLRYQFVAPKVITQYTVTGATSGLGTNRSPNTWTFEGSQDASTWVVLQSPSAQSGWGSLEVRTFNPPNLDFYLYYRMNISSNNGGAILQFAELRLIGYS